MDSLSRGTEVMMSRRGFLVKKVLVPVGGIFGIAALWPLASLVPRPGDELYHTKWYPGARLVTEDGRAINVGDISVDGLVTVWPEGFIDSPESAAVVINIGGAPVQPRPGQAGFEVISGANGLVAFSKVCTHAGCAVSLFNVLSLQLICPCHQSTFNILQDCKPVFGPASRPLPQLPLGVSRRRLPDRQERFHRAGRPRLLEQGRRLTGGRCQNAPGEPVVSTVAERSAARKRAQHEQKALDWADDRLGTSKWLRSAMDKIFPDHWSFMVGEIAMYSFVLLDSDGHLPGVLLQGFRRHGHLPRPLQTPRWPVDDRGVRLDHQHLLQCPGGPRNAPGAPLGCSHFPGLNCVPHVPHFLHRGLPPSA